MLKIVRRSAMAAVRRGWKGPRRFLSWRIRQRMGAAAIPRVRAEMIDSLPSQAENPICRSAAAIRAPANFFQWGLGATFAGRMVQTRSAATRGDHIDVCCRRMTRGAKKAAVAEVRAMVWPTPGLGAT